MIAIEADFNHLDGQGRLLLGDLAVHAQTPFRDIAESAERILFVDGDEFVEGRVLEDPTRGWVGDADWDTHDTLRAYPARYPAPLLVGH